MCIVTGATVQLTLEIPAAHAYSAGRRCLWRPPHRGQRILSPSSSARRRGTSFETWSQSQQRPVQNKAPRTRLQPRLKRSGSSIQTSGISATKLSASWMSCLETWSCTPMAKMSVRSLESTLLEKRKHPAKNSRRRLRIFACKRSSNSMRCSIVSMLHMIVQATLYLLRRAQRNQDQLQMSLTCHQIVCSVTMVSVENRTSCDQMWMRCLIRSCRN
mmetsp:Transcript_32647/g.59602  ORF Transcript_32647/g.59602 Transcript_32647/m.59602 type:complete len:216 (-) Transcript_32647:307-954(-)